MRTKSRFSSTAVAVLIISLVSVSSLYGQRGMGPRGQGNGNMPCYAASNLNLTADQEEKISSLRIEHLKATTPIRNRMGESRARLQTLRTTDGAGINDINREIDEFTKLKGELMKQNAAHRANVANVLTDEQRAIYNAQAPRGRGDYGMGMRGQQGKGRGMNRADCVYRNRGWN